MNLAQCLMVLKILVIKIRLKITKGVIRSRKSKDKQYNDQRKEQKDKKEQFVDGKRSNQKL
jgi:hypothetical protein